MTGPSLYRRLRRGLKSFVVRQFLSYDRAALVRALAGLGVRPGDTVMVHASWLPENGFRGGAPEFVAALVEAVGADADGGGLVVMPTMTYHNESSADFLARGAPMDVRRSPSRMGLLSEVFRRDPRTRRSLSPTHPLAARGAEAEAFLAGHDRALAPFGPESPFARLPERDARILLVDAPFSTVTFTHFLEDRIQAGLAMPFYEPEPRTGAVVDEAGVKLEVPCLVISEAANKARREHLLVAELERAGAFRRARIGNTGLAVLDARAMVEVADRMAANGRTFFADGKTIR